MREKVTRQILGYEKRLSYRTYQRERPEIMKIIDYLGESQKEGAKEIRKLIPWLGDNKTPYCYEDPDGDRAKVIQSLFTFYFPERPEDWDDVLQKYLKKLARRGFDFKSAISGMG